MSKVYTNRLQKFREKKIWGKDSIPVSSDRLMFDLILT